MKQLILILALLLVGLSVKAAPASLTVKTNKEARLTLSFYSNEQLFNHLMRMPIGEVKIEAIEQENLEFIPQGLIKRMDLEQPVLALLSVDEFTHAFWINPNQDRLLHLKQDGEGNWSARSERPASEAEQALHAFHEAFPTVLGNERQQAASFAALQEKMADYTRWYEEKMIDKFDAHQRSLFEAQLYWRPILSWSQLRQVIDQSLAAGPNAIAWEELAQFIFSPERLQILENNPMATASAIGWGLPVLFSNALPNQPKFLHSIKQYLGDSPRADRILLHYCCRSCQEAGSAEATAFPEEIRQLLDRTTDEEMRERLQKACYGRE